MVLYYKKVVPGDINILPPVKCSGTKRYESFIVYSDTTEDFVIQSPKIKYNSEKGFYFSMIKYPEFLTFLEEINQKVIEIIHSKSETFFKGKTFSEEIISNAVDNFYFINNDGIVSIKSKFFECVETPSENSLVRVMMKFEKIIFDKNKIYPFIKILKTKKSEKKNVKPDTCILSEDESTEICEISPRPQDL